MSRSKKSKLKRYRQRLLQRAQTSVPRQSPQPSRQALETLEPRLLFSSVIGTLYEDRNADGVIDAGEPTLSGRTIYIDANENGELNAGETQATTDINGQYQFDALVAGTYNVRAVLPSGYANTVPGYSQTGEAVVLGSGQTVVLDIGAAPVTAEWAQTIRPSGAEAGDRWGGGTVAIDGDTMAVASQTSDDFADGAGAVILYERDAQGQWVEDARLYPDLAETGSAFGRRMALLGDTLVVSASLADDADPDAGAVYVFERDPQGAWARQQKLVANDAAQNDFFGSALALSNDTLVIAAEGENNIVADSGSLYVFEKDISGLWLQVDKLNTGDALAGDRMGSDSIVIEGDRLRYKKWMATRTTDEPALLQHLEAELQREA